MVYRVPVIRLDPIVGLFSSASAGLPGVLLLAFGDSQFTRAVRVRTTARTQPLSRRPATGNSRQADYAVHFWWRVGDVANSLEYSNSRVPDDHCRALIQSGSGCAVFYSCNPGKGLGRPPFSGDASLSLLR